MKNVGGSEKRRHPRFPVGITMDIHAKGHTVGKCRGTISDLSVGGMSFKTTSALETGASLYLKINIPLEIRGEVRHIRAGSGGGMHRYGVRFHKIGFFSADSLKAGDFIAARFSKQRRD
ncbi:MAG: PilZ domain-containing protein [Elusimicrobia bacterium]|nr:PilZ domain-containing protein [Elusimicrobiota bacterium]